MKEHKPMMGTVLVPSIENLEGCYKYGGQWNKKYEVCIDKNNRMLVPIKGALISWKQEHDPHHSFTVKVLRLRDLKEFYKKNFVDEHSSKTTAMSIASAFLNDKADVLRLYGLGCYDYKTGKAVSCKHNSAVIGPNPLSWDARHTRYEIPRIFIDPKSRKLPVDVDEKKFYYGLWADWASKKMIYNLRKHKKTTLQKKFDEVV